ncbi:MAG: sugar-transfer associated ATP-grasp domain-containing protein [Eubacteriales bacterium]|nr:sugar-transfer associated ATP-grasp domain-containing protein [Eubacteriales bacterium]
MWNEFVENIRCIITGNYIEGRTDLNTLCNLALIRIDRKTVTPSIKGLPKLSGAQKKQIKRLYGPYVRHMTDRYHRYYTHASGIFRPDYLPEELYVTRVDRYFSDRQEARFLDNKCYYYRLFSNVKQPEAVGMRIGKSWLDAGLQAVTWETLRERLAKEPELVVKRAVNSQGGSGVSFLDEKDSAERLRRLDSLVGQIPCDLVIQRPVRQHPGLMRLHPESVNTLRIVSLLTQDKVKICAVCLKIGVGKERVDNGCHGGIYCGVRPDGSLRARGVLDNGQTVERHPQLGYRLAEQKVPCLKQALALVRRAHPFLGHFRLISWDVAIDEKGEAVLIEANLSLGGINDVQITTGPLFGRDTKRVLNEVFGGKRRRWSTWF